MAKISTKSILYKIIEYPNSAIYYCDFSAIFAQFLNIAHDVFSQDLRSSILLPLQTLSASAAQYRQRACWV